MKILLVSPFDFAYPGGVNEHILHLDNQFQMFGHQTRILAPRSSDDNLVEDDGHFFRAGTTVPIPANGSTARITLSPFVSGKIKEFLRRERFDVIHLHEALTPMVPLLALLHSRTVNVATYHAARTSSLGYRFGKPVLSRLDRKLDARIAVSSTALEFIHKYFPGNYEVIPNGIDIHQFRPDVASFPRYTRSGPTILFVGRFNESRKGLKYLLKAMAVVRQQFPRCRLIVVGSGHPGQFDGLINRYKLDNVVFAGPVPKSGLASFYASCDVFCAPSTGRESFGIVLLEAMASGKPVVATNIKGYTAVVRHGVEGLLVERENPEALATALVRVLADAELRKRFGMAGRVRAIEHSWPVIAEKVLQTYERVLAHAGRTGLTRRRIRPTSLATRQ